MAEDNKPQVKFSGLQMASLVVIVETIGALLEMMKDPKVVTDFVQGMDAIKDLLGQRDELLQIKNDGDAIAEQNRLDLKAIEDFNNFKAKTEAALADREEIVATAEKAAAKKLVAAEQAEVLVNDKLQSVLDREDAVAGREKDLDVVEKQAAKDAAEAASLREQYTGKLQNLIKNA